MSLLDSFYNEMYRNSDRGDSVRRLLVTQLHGFFYKHGVFQSEARICLSFSQSEPQNMLKICLS